MEIVNSKTVVLYKCYGVGCRPLFSFHKKGYDNIKYLADIPHGCYFDTCKSWGGAMLVYKPDGSPMMGLITDANCKGVFDIGGFDGKIYRFTNLRKAVD